MKSVNPNARVISLTTQQESLYGFVRDKVDLDDSAAFTVRRLFSKMRIDTASTYAVSRLVNRALRDAENISAYVVRGMQNLAVEHKAKQEAAPAAMSKCRPCRTSRPREDTVSWKRARLPE